MKNIVSKSKRVFYATNSNAILAESKNIFSIFFCIFGSYIKPRIPSKSFRGYLFLKLKIQKNGVT